MKVDSEEKLTYKKFRDKWDAFWIKRIAGETIVWSDLERFMQRTSAKNLKLLMKGKKAEGYMEGSMDKMLTTSQKKWITSLAVILMVIFIGLYMLRTQGMI